MTLPDDVVVLERGWLSSNNVLLTGDGPASLVDTGHLTHSAQTLDLLRRQLSGRPLEVLVNTHLHSDHCGGNAMVQAEFPAVRTCIPPGLSDAVRRWDVHELSYAPTGQSCQRFGFDEVLGAGQTLQLGQRAWNVYAAPGHDPHSVILFEPDHRILISADALWENGFGVVFPELEGDSAFDEVAATLDVIETLKPRIVIPGHGRVFTDVALALSNARRRLEQFVKNPRKHAIYAAKVLLKYKLLELQRVNMEDFSAWVSSTPYFAIVHQRYFQDEVFDAWWRHRLDELIATNAASLSEGVLRNR